MIYLASPYTHSDPNMQEARYIAACAHLGEMLKAGIFAFSPIAYSVPICRHGGMEDSWNAWEWIDKRMVAKSSCVHVLKLPGWLNSVGVLEEIRFAEELCVPIEHIEPDPLLTPKYCNRFQGVSP